VIHTVLQIAGSLGLLIYGMKVLSEGIQHAAGERLHSILQYMTINRFAAVFTGFLVTVLVQSSSATTVMVVSFVNAALLSLTQAIGVIMGANIGTTVTGWIVAVFGFTFKITAAALPAIGIGAVLVFSKRFRKNDLGETLIGFGLLFLGLSFLRDSIPDVSAYPQALEQIAALSGHGFLSLLVFIGVGALLTILVQSSSAAMAITLTMAYAGWIDYPTSAAIILGENIGTTVTANLAALGGSRNGRRAARAHLLFNLFGVLWMLPVFPLFLKLVNFILPGDVFSIVSPGILPAHLALFHTLFNVFNTLICIGFIPVIVSVSRRLVPGVEEDFSERYAVPIASRFAYGSADLYLYEVRHEILRMASIVAAMVRSCWTMFSGTKSSPAKELESLQTKENYVDQMHEEISRVLASFSEESLGRQTVASITSLMRITHELERIADSCFNIGIMAERRFEKSIDLPREALAELNPYAELVEDFVRFVSEHAAEPGDPTVLQPAREFESKVNRKRDKLKKSARKRIRKGGDLRAELLVIDAVGHLEHMGDYSLNIAEALTQMGKRESSGEHSESFRNAKDSKETRDAPEDSPADVK
jgi:phosphate:Na+ symporter